MIEETIAERFYDLENIRPSSIAFSENLFTSKLTFQTFKINQTYLRPKDREDFRIRNGKIS